MSIKIPAQVPNVDFSHLSNEKSAHHSGDKKGAIVIKDPGSPAVVYTPSDAKKDAAEASQGHLYDAATINRLKEHANQSLNQLRETVRALVERQGLTFEDVLSAIDQGKEVSIEIDEATRANAQAAIADDGEWGVQKTSERIIDFAKAISGNDKGKYDQLLASIKEGFEAAKEAFGGELPDISQKTYDAVLSGLETWATSA